MSARLFVQTMIALASASLGLVAALAWNEAIKATILATGLAIVVLLALARLAARIGGEVLITREAEG